MAKETPIYYSPYTLRSKGALNSASTRQEHHGVLLNIGDGFANLHPWPELGDPSLDKCLADLSGKRRWPIVRRAVRCAEMDTAARQHEDWLFEELEVPESHYTCPSLERQQIELALASGFTIIKLKCGKDLTAEGLFLREASAAHPTLKWRLDFNEQPTREQTRDFILGLPDQTRDAIDFLEDPCPFSEKSWAQLHRETRTLLALDRQAGPNTATSAAAQLIVIKPAIDEPWLLAEAALNAGQRVLLTSYMDHPLGQTFAAWEAGRLSLQFPGLIQTCGLQTHHLFEPNPFTEALGDISPTFSPYPFTGLGFDELLDELTWKALS